MVIPQQELYHEIYLRLLEMIQNKRFYSGKLPPEEQLAEALEIGRMTLRDVLGALEANGYVVRKKGIGTIVNRHALSPQIRLDINQFFPDALRDAGYQSRVRLLRLELQTPNKTVAKHLDISLQDKVVRIEKLFYADEHPLIYVKTYLPEHATTLKERNRCGMYDITFSTDRIKLENSRSTLNACLPSTEVAELLRISIDEPILRVFLDGYDHNGNTVMCSEEYFKTGPIDYTVFQKIIPEMNSVFFYYDDRE